MKKTAMTYAWYEKCFLEFTDKLLRVHIKNSQATQANVADVGARVESSGYFLTTFRTFSVIAIAHDSSRNWLIVTRKTKRSINVNRNLCSDQQPVVGGIYHDKSDNSLVVLSIVGSKVLLEYACGTVTSIDAKNWQLLEPHVAIY